jgi:hypothetical protein
MPGGAALELEIAIPQYNTYAGNAAKVALPTGHFFWERLLQGPLELARPDATSPTLHPMNIERLQSLPRRWSRFFGTVT